MSRGLSWAGKGKEAWVDWSRRSVVAQERQKKESSRTGRAVGEIRAQLRIVKS